MRATNLKSNLATNEILRISDEQRKFLISGTYEVYTPFGSVLSRKLNIVGLEPSTGNLLIKESYSGNSGYKKLFVLCPDGMTEKLKSQSFINIH